jgi:hypothetical protein
MLYTHKVSKQNVTTTKLNMNTTALTLVISSQQAKILIDQYLYLLLSHEIGRNRPVVNEGELIIASDLLNIPLTTSGQNTRFDYPDSDNHKDIANRNKALANCGLENSGLQVARHDFMIEGLPLKVINVVDSIGNNVSGGILVFGRINWAGGGTRPIYTRFSPEELNKVRKFVQHSH